MNMPRIAAMLAATAITASTHALAAEEKPEIYQAEKVSPPAVSGQETALDLLEEETRVPEQVVVQTEEQFLSEIKVYPSF